MESCNQNKLTIEERLESLEAAKSAYEEAKKIYEKERKTYYETKAAVIEVVKSLQHHVKSLEIETAGNSGSIVEINRKLEQISILLTDADIPVIPAETVEKYGELSELWLSQPQAVKLLNKSYGMHLSADDGIVKPLLAAGFIESCHSSPESTSRTYRLTEKGKKAGFLLVGEVGLSVLESKIEELKKIVEDFYGTE